MTLKQAKRGTTADENMRRRARALEAAIGDREAAKRLGIGRATLSRLLAGQLLAPGTLALVREYFAKEPA